MNWKNCLARQRKEDKYDDKFGFVGMMEMKQKLMCYLAEQIRGVSYKPDDLHKQLDENSVILLRANNIDDGQINFDDVVYVDRSKVSCSQFLRKGDILVCASSGSRNLVGKAAQIDFEGNYTFGAFCKVVRPKEIDAEYLGMYFLSPTYRSIIASLAQGANINNIKNEHIDSLIVNIGNENECQQIVNILSRLLKVIHLRQQEIKELDDLIKARFVEMFTDKGFQKTTIGSLVANKVPTAKKSFAPSDTIKYIDISSIDNKRNIMTGYTEYILEDAPSRAQQHIQKNDIVVSTVRPNLKNVAITGYNDNNLIASSGFCVLRVEKCLPSYLMAIVCSDDFTNAMTKVVTGANYPAIKDSDVKNYVIPLPPIDLQNEFAKFVEETDKSKVAIQKSLAETQLLFDSLMQKYFG